MNGVFTQQYHRLGARRGKKKALVAVGHSILVIAYHVLTRKQPYCDLAANYFDERDRQAVIKRCLSRVQKLGYKVSLEKCPSLHEPYLHKSLSLRSIAGIRVRDTCSCSFGILDHVFTDTSTKIDLPLRCSSPACIHTFSAPSSLMMLPSNLLKELFPGGRFPLG